MRMNQWDMIMYFKHMGNILKDCSENAKAEKELLKEMEEEISEEEDNADSSDSGLLFFLLCYENVQLFFFQSIDLKYDTWNVCVHVIALDLFYRGYNLSTKEESSCQKSERKVVLWLRKFHRTRCTKKEEETRWAAGCQAIKQWLGHFTQRQKVLNQMKYLYPVIKWQTK